MSDLEVTIITSPQTDALNQVILNTVQNLNAEEEKQLRAMLADAWDDGHRTALNHPVSGHWNPYRP